MVAVCTTRAGVVRIRGPLSLAPRRQYTKHLRHTRLIVLPHYETHKTSKSIVFRTTEYISGRSENFTDAL
jgi:hypothetical protein